MAGVVIVGAGQAGGRLALTLRKLGFLGPVTLVGEEPLPPYERPPLSKGALAGSVAPGDARLASPAEYAEAGIDLRIGERVERLNVDSRCIRLSDGTRLPYDDLVLATGARARTISSPGADRSGVLSLRSAADCDRLCTRLKPGHRLVVIGGGFIGLEAAASARARGCLVTVLEAGARPLMRSAPRSIAEAVVQKHENEGVQIEAGVSVNHIDFAAGTLRIHLETGEFHSADTVLVAVGARPETALAVAAGLAVDDGVLTDSACRASAHRTWAVGDCARAEIPRFGLRVRMESFQNADRQAEACARAILGESVCYDPVPWLWSDHYDWTLHTAGILGTEGKIVHRPLNTEGAKLSFAVRDDKVNYAAGFGPVSEVAQPVRVAQMLIENGKTISPMHLADPAIPMKRILRD